MRKLAFAAIILTAAAALAVEVPFRDGSVIEAVGYTVNGSYVMLEMPSGARVAYDVADVDLEALRQAEAAEELVEAPAPAETLGTDGSLRLPPSSTEGSGGLTITDQHVKHVRGSGIEGPEDETQAGTPEADAVPAGFEQGGNVLLNNVKVKPLEGGQWEVSGEVVNRTSDTVLDIRANLEAAVPDGDPWTASVPVSGALDPDQKAEFSHVFSTPDGAGDGWSPQVQVNVVWMKSETRIEPNYDRTAPHPSALPYDRGGVGGAETRREEVEL